MEKREYSHLKKWEKGMENRNFWIEKGGCQDKNVALYLEK